MNFGFPARHSSELSLQYHGSKDLRQLVQDALHALSWPIECEDETHTFAFVRMNIWSWGEKITIDYLPQDTIRVTSRCSFPLQCFDWGKNSRNVAELARKLRVDF